MDNKPLIIYHGNCADGFAAAWCFWKKYGPDGAEYLAGVYQQPPPPVDGRHVFLVDFSYKRAIVEQMVAKAASVTLIDHHKTAIEDLDGLPGLARYTDQDRSGATLAWDFLYPGEPHPLLLGHIEDRDLWRFKLPNTREIQANVFSYEYTFEGWDKLMKADQAELLNMTVAGAAIERKHHKDIAELVTVCQREMCIGGHWVPAASLPYTLTSDAGHLMCRPYPSANLQGEIVTPPFAACYWDTADGRIFSLRSRDEGMDVSEVAKQYGGGGHPHASGFKVPRDHELARA